MVVWHSNPHFQRETGPRSTIGIICLRYLHSSVAGRTHKLEGFFTAHPCYENAYRLYRPDCLTGINSERPPRGGGLTHVLWRVRGPERGLQVPRPGRGGVYQVNRARLVGL